MKKIICLIIVLVSTKCFSQINVVPMPAEVEMGIGFSFIKQPVGFIIFNDDLIKGNDGIEMFKRYLKRTYNIKVFKDGDTHSYGFPFEILYGTVDEDKPNGYYELDINNNKVYLKGTALGKFYAFETLKQLIKKNNKGEIIIPNCRIKDFPRFSYRGMHLDVCRHFFPVSYIKKYIDYLATYKYNTFHWHLTEDQGWRIEIKKYPNLTKVGSKRKRTLIGNYGSNKYDSIQHGGYYTQAQIKEIVQYATDRHITVIPEIEMPGHSTAALASYPYLGCTKGPYKVMDTWGVIDDVYCAGNDSTFIFLQNVLDEVLQLFPSKYIHIGGDECPKERWKKCDVCQKRMKDYKLNDEHGLQSYFIQRIEKYLNKKGRNIIGWDEILEGGLAPNATVMSWRGEAGGIEAAKQNHDVIMTPGSHCYLDHSQAANEDSLTIGGYLPLEKIYNYEPVPSVLNSKQQTHVLGAQGNVWTEYIANTKKLEYMIFPRMIALSEVLWSPKDKRNWKDFKRRLPTIFEQLEKEKINYSKSYYEPIIKVVEKNNHKGISLFIKSNQPNTSFLLVNIAKHEVLQFKDSISIDIIKSAGYRIKITGRNKAKLTKPDSYYSIWEANETLFEIGFLLHVNKATGKKITLINQPSKTYSGDGAFTLVNGVQNEKGLAKPSEFLGFQGTDVEAIIDLDTTIEITKVNLHAFEKKNSWIYYPKAGSVEVLVSLDGINFTNPPNAVTSLIPNETGIISVTYTQGQEENRMLQQSVKAKYIKVIAKNFGFIPNGQPGEGNPAWLFVDEIEVF